jgi:hypothetical protein
MLRNAMSKIISTLGRAAIICVLLVLGTNEIRAASDGDPSATTQPATDDLPQARSMPELKIQGIALPASWRAGPVKTADTHIDAEWQAPSGLTVFGAVCIHVPPLMGGKGLVNSVKNNYVKRQPDGKMTNEWTDSSQRDWFEVDAAGTHSKGFVITRGHHAWFVYYRYATKGHSPQDEISVADQAINHVEPIAE